MKTRYLKVIRDLTSDYPKNFMLVLAITIGVFGVGSILGGYAILKREMSSNYNGTIPASATIEVGSDISNALIDSVKAFAGILEVERHATLVARMKVNDRWHPLLLFVIDDFAAKRMNKIYPVSGLAEPPENTMLVERTALVVMQAVVGDVITIKTSHAEPKSIRISGTVHDPGLAPAWQEQAGYGYITLSTLHWLGETQGFDQLRILVSEHQDSRDHITEKAEELSTWLEQKGYTIHEIQVPPPGKHPHQGQMNAVLSIFTLFSYLLLILGSVLVATSIATLMVKQVRQIGVMKTIGAEVSQVIGMYLFMMLVLCVVSLFIAIPLSQITAKMFSYQIAGLLNLELTDGSIPYWVPLVQVASGILIPFVVAAFPVIRGSRVTVRIALDNYGVSQQRLSYRSWMLRLPDPGFVSESFKLSVRNVFRLRSRLVMTLGLLAAGGGMFMAAINVSEAWDENLQQIYTQRLYDLEVRLNEPVAPDSIVDKIESLPGVTACETWNYSSTSIAKENSHEISHTYPDKGHGSFSMLAVPVPTRLLNPTVVEGRWLMEGSTDDVVLNQSARRETRIGDRVKLMLDGKATEWTVVGFTQDVGSPATAYVSMRGFSQHAGISGKVRMIRVAYADRSKEKASRKNREVETLLQKENISVSSTIPVWLLHNAVAAHMRVLVNSLLAMALLMAMVGTLGLASTMSMNVMERTREIGVMRAIGATPVKIRNLIVWEGLIIGSMSILLAFVLSIFLSSYLGRFIGRISFGTPLSLTISAVAFAIWIGIVVVGSYVATVFPARRASRITTREALAYE
jgi:putative ABC transport system permease protein